MKRLLFVGDVVGDSGCGLLAERLYSIKKEHSIDITVVNGENSAPSNGINRHSAEFLLSNGADVITTGNHCFKWRDALDIYREGNILRPANYPEGTIGSGVCVLDMGAYSVAVINLMGTLYLEALDNPFTVIDRLLEDIGTPNIFVDFHAEATSEKKCLGHYLTGRVTAVLGTHTHVQTADELVLGGHTAYITDVGMTGPELSVLGVTTDIAIKKQRTHMPVKFTVSEEKPFINAVVVTFDEHLGKSEDIKRLIIR